MNKKPIVGTSLQNRKSITVMDKISRDKVTVKKTSHDQVKSKSKSSSISILPVKNSSTDHYLDDDPRELVSSKGFIISEKLEDKREHVSMIPVSIEESPLCPTDTANSGISIHVLAESISKLCSSLFDVKLTNGLFALCRSSSIEILLNSIINSEYNTKPYLKDQHKKLCEELLFVFPDSLQELVKTWFSANNVTKGVLSGYIQALDRDIDLRIAHISANIYQQLNEIDEEERGDDKYSGFGRKSEKEGKDRDREKQLQKEKKSEKMKDSKSERKSERKKPISLNSRFSDDVISTIHAATVYTGNAMVFSAIVHTLADISLQQPPPHPTLNWQRVLVLCEAICGGMGKLEVGNVTGNVASWFIALDDLFDGENARVKHTRALNLKYGTVSSSDFVQELLLDQKEFLGENMCNVTRSIGDRKHHIMGDPQQYIRKAIILSKALNRYVATYINRNC